MSVMRNESVEDLKKCVDGNDGSDSSDSGVGQLGCTDCSSTRSSASEADPGSPYSSYSSHGDDSAPSPPATFVTTSTPIFISPIKKATEYQTDSRLRSSSTNNDFRTWSDASETCETSDPKPSDPPSTRKNFSNFLLDKLLNDQLLLDHITDSSDDSIPVTFSEDSVLSTASTKDPILSAPRTIRFPRSYSFDSQYDSLSSGGSTCTSSCKWLHCQMRVEASAGLIEHLQIQHVIPQAKGKDENFSCLWLGCKVFGKKSCSRSWLERHVLSHAGNKVFRCIVDGCGLRFNTQGALQRHVNGHFNSTESSTGSNSRKIVDNSGNKILLKRHGKMRYRPQPRPERAFDFFDDGIVQKITYRLWKLEKRRTLGKFADCPPDSVAFRVMDVSGTRTTADGRVEYLAKFFPPEIIDHEWISNEEMTHAYKYVPINRLHQSDHDALYKFWSSGLNDNTFESKRDASSTCERLVDSSETEHNDMPFKTRNVDANGLTGGLIGATEPHNGALTNTCKLNKLVCVSRRKSRRRKPPYVVVKS